MDLQFYLTFFIQEKVAPTPCAAGFLELLSLMLDLKPLGTLHVGLGTSKHKYVCFNRHQQESASLTRLHVFLKLSYQFMHVDYSALLAWKFAVR